MEAEGFSKELEKIRAGKIKDEEKKAKRIFLEAPFSAEEAKTTQKELAKSLGKLMDAKIDLGRGVKLEMVLIPAGKFMMGSPGAEVSRRENETQHEVTLTKPIYMGKYEVTQEQWQAVMGNNPSSVKVARLPVNNVSWNDCQDFIGKLNAYTNGGYRLPTEAEWEYACRAGTTTVYSFGDNITPKDANFLDSKLGAPVVVGRYKPNAFGFFDMHGNVLEWCEDWDANYPAEPRTDPKGAGTGKGRMLRGGSFLDNASFTRSSNRIGNSPNERNHAQFGFRLVRIN